MKRKHQKKKDAPASHLKYMLHYPDYTYDTEQQLRLFLQKYAKHAIYAHTNIDIRGLVTFSERKTHKELARLIIDWDLPILFYNTVVDVNTLRPFIEMDINKFEMVAPVEPLKRTGTLADAYKEAKKRQDFINLVSEKLKVETKEQSFDDKALVIYGKK